MGRGRTVMYYFSQNTSHSPLTERRMHQSLPRYPKQEEQPQQEISSPVSLCTRSHAPAPSSIAARDDERSDASLSLGERPNIPVNSPNSVKAWEITKRSKDPQ